MSEWVRECALLPVRACCPIPVVVVIVVPQAQVMQLTVKGSEVTYSINVTLSNERPSNIKESALRKCRSRTKVDKGEGIYHWEGMTDDEDEEWNPEKLRTRASDGGRVRTRVCLF